VTQSTKQQVLNKAVELGGLEDVASALNAPSRLVEAWLRGVAVMPDRHIPLLAEFLCKHVGRHEA
jgi:hypothetical protein